MVGKASSVRRLSMSPLLARVKELQRRMGKWKASALLVTNPRDIRYLTGFAGDDSWAVVCARSSRVYVLSDFRFQEQIQREAPQVAARIRKGPMSEELARLAAELRLRRVAIPQDYVTVAQRKMLEKKIGRGRLVDVADGLIEQRAVKDSGEVKAIQKALAIQQEAFESLKQTLEPGQREEEVAASLEFLMRSMGAHGVGFPTIAAADANASLPHAVPGKNKLRKGGILLIDWGARWDGYCGDLTRVLALGGMPARIREIYRIVLDAQLAAIDAIGPGKMLKDIDGVARDLITKAGFGKEFGHSTGHGIGLDIHEQPTLSARSEGELEPGQVVTVEPGIYLPGVGGVRIEDNVLVTQRGCKVLSYLPKDIESAII